MLKDLKSKILTAYSNTRVRVATFLVLLVMGLAMVYYVTHKADSDSDTYSYEYGSNTAYPQQSNAYPQTTQSTYPILPSEVESEGSRKCNALSPAPDIQTKVSRFRCNDSILNNGYDSCDLDIQYSVTTYCTPSSYGSMINCDFQAEAFIVDGILPDRKYETASQPLNFYNGNATGLLSMRINVSNVLGVTYKVRPTNLSCSVSGL